MTETANLRAANGGQILVQCLLTQGVERAYCVPGESYLAVLDAFVDAPEIQVVTCRQEGGAAMMAAADGKLAGKPGVCFVTRGPGATNASAGVHLARQASIPMVLFIGQVGRDTRDREAFQEIDYRQMFGGIAKWVAEIDSPQRVAEYVQRAFAVASAGRPGPVVLALPEDMLCETVPSAAPIPPRHPRSPAPSATDIEYFHQLLSASRRPLVLCGEADWSGARDALHAWCESQQLPVAAAFRCQDNFDNDNPLYIGDIGLGLNPALRRRIESADLVICLGGRFSEIVTQNYSILQAHTGQRIIYVHPCADELAAAPPVDLAITASMENLLQALPVKPVPPTSSERREWMETARAEYEQWNRPGAIPGRLQYGEIVAWLREQLDDDAIICNGAGNYAIWVHRFFRYRRANTQLAPISGSMGYGLPAAIAAKLRFPSRQVVCFAGDGCLQMTLQEMATACQFGANILLIVVNNGSLGTIRMHQERTYPGRTSATDLYNPDFVALARAYGFYAESVDETKQFAAAYAAAMAASRPALLELKLPLEALTPNLKLSELAKLSEQ
ncbi:acetolactate synthase-1/2/3 large subunit [Microbulbifer donghaiensis]|uniref:Acetolactate synthase-1/2/3 large subunit n=1 Tax=Microbulbifer donghaiensis TaxID=494016 RepID=A0A1M5CE76_9GAMM|nr:thiamine pyrophosphate-binding protein [Microbulbifer donghaiensis]SHF53001.1 acetolactate synthase-1/2/3 large subunit [Microbulbifer donghaiensis]